MTDAGLRAVYHHDCQFRHDHVDGIDIVEVHGELDWVSAPRLHRLLRADGHPVVIVDLSGATSLDAQGMGVVLAAVGRRSARSQRTALVTASRGDFEAFDTFGVSDAVPVYDTVADAIAHLAASR